MVLGLLTNILLFPLAQGVDQWWPGMLNQVAIREPGTRIEPTDQRERRPAIAPLAVLPDGANLQGMFLASFALLVAGQRGGMGDPQLAGQVGDHARGHLKEITHKTAQIPRGAELDRKPSRLWSPRRSPSRSQSSASK